MNTPEQPTAMQLLAKELLAEFGPLLVEYVRKSQVANANELLTIPEISKELKVRRSVVTDLIKIGTLRKVSDIGRARVSRRELERYTSGR